MLPTGADGAKERWKYTRYWDNTDFWSSPGQLDAMTVVDGILTNDGRKVANTVVKYANPTGDQAGPAPDEIEVYNVTQDPTELTNLASDPQYADVVALLKSMLNEEVSRKRLEPTIEPWADGSSRFTWSPLQAGRA